MPHHPIDLSAEPKQFGAIRLRLTHIQLILEETIDRQPSVLIDSAAAKPNLDER